VVGAPFIAGPCAVPVPSLRPTSDALFAAGAAPIAGPG